MLSAWAVRVPVDAAQQVQEEAYRRDLGAVFRLVLAAAYRQALGEVCLLAQVVVDQQGQVVACRQVLEVVCLLDPAVVDQRARAGDVRLILLLECGFLAIAKLHLLGFRISSLSVWASPGMWGPNTLAISKGTD